MNARDKVGGLVKEALDLKALKTLGTRALNVGVGAAVVGTGGYLLGKKAKDKLALKLSQQNVEQSTTPPELW